MSLLCNGTDGYAAAVSALSGFPAANANQTISVWFKYSSNPSGSKTMVSLSNNGSSSGVRLGFSNPGGGTTPSVRKFDGTVLAQAATLPSTNVWHHMAYTFDGTTHRLYIDGVADGTSATAANTATPDNLNFARNSDNTEFFAGNIDDARVYNRVLTANGVLTLANCQGHDGITSGMVGRWGFRSGATSPSGIGYSYTEVTSNQTVTGTTAWTDISGASIASSSFIPGRKYLVMINAQISKDSGNVVLIQCRTLHGSTEFTSSERSRNMGSADTGRFSYMYFTVWTAVSGEGIKVQFAEGNTAGTTNANFVTLTAIDLTRFVEGVDWHYDVDTTATNVGSITWSTTNNGTITFTPGTAGHDWLVMAYSQVTGASTTANTESRINRSGEASSTLPLISMEGNGGSEIQAFANMRVFNLGASSNTFEEQSRQDAASGSPSRTMSAVFAINLNKFVAHGNVYTEAETAAFSTTNYATEVQSASITMSAAAHLWAWGFWLCSANSQTVSMRGRMQVDDSDAPAGQTTAAYQRDEANDTTDLHGVHNQAVLSVSSGSRTIALDASETTGITNTARNRSIAAVQLEPGAVADDLAGSTYVVLAGTASFGDTALARRRRNP